MEAPASELLGLMLLRAGWFVYAALDLEYSPGVLPHGMVRITLLEQVRNRQGLPDLLPQAPPREQGGLAEGEVREGRGEGDAHSDRVPLQGHGAFHFRSRFGGLDGGAPPSVGEMVACIECVASDCNIITLLYSAPASTGRGLATRPPARGAP